jgi:hypothetical protein
MSGGMYPEGLGKWGNWGAAKSSQHSTSTNDWLEWNVRFYPSLPPAEGAGSQWVRTSGPSSKPHLCPLVPPASRGGVPVPALPGLPGPSQVPQAAALFALAVLRMPGGEGHAMPHLPGAPAPGR